MLILFAGRLPAQNYVYTQTMGTAKPYNILETSATTIMEAPAVPGGSLPNQMSAWNSIPFAWTYYGVPVSGYYVSDNGYITFDSSASIAVNDTLPATGGPNNAIYAFWDDIEIKEDTGAIDKVKSWTYGQSPNRVHVIQWHSVTAGDSVVTSANSPTFIYAVIRIYECGDFDIIHPYGNSSGWTATAGCENVDGTLGTMVGGSATIDYPAGASSSDPADDVVYHFYYNAQPLTDLTIISETGLDPNIVVGNHTLTGIIQNRGSDNITSFDLNYTVDGGTPVTTNIGPITLAANGGSYSYSHDSLINAPTGGVFHNIKIWASNINGNADDLPCNDTLEKTVFVNNDSTTTRKVLFEEFTGAWCGYCPDGHLEIDKVLAAYPDVIPVMIHSGSGLDSMKVQEGLDIAAEYGVNTYPRAMIDRVLYDGEDMLHVSRSNNAWMNHSSIRVNTGAPATVTVSQTWNESTRVIDAIVTVDFVDYAAGDMRINLYVVEDHVIGDTVTGGTATGYDQVNYYSSQSQAAGGTAHAYYNFSDPITLYDHRYVLRAVPSGALGTGGVIPSPVTPGESYSRNYSYTLPAAYNEVNINLIGFVSYYNPADLKSNEILNVGSPSPVGIEEIANAQINVSEIYPNPMSTIGFLRLNVKEKSRTNIVLYNIMGQLMLTVMDRELQQGSYRVSIDVSGLCAGVYYVNIYAGRDRITKKFVLAK